MTTRREQLGITGRKMYEGEKINPSTDLPKFLNTNKATETGAQKGYVSTKRPELKVEDEAALLRQHIVDTVSKVGIGVAEPLEICRQINQAVKTSLGPGDLRLKAVFDSKNKEFYFNFSRGEKTPYFSFGPISEQEVHKLIPK